ncbi:MAG: hypothetical protein H0X42_08385 [Solirubrobacterales bacterium]|nr:hypothetical protein [Solirubrobacterales bacterium]
MALIAVPVAIASDSAEVIQPQNNPPSAADGWQSINCIEDILSPTEKCSPSTPSDYFKVAGGHSPFGFTQYVIKHTAPVPGTIEPLVEPQDKRDIKTLRVELPAGLIVNPLAVTERCPVKAFEEAKCATEYPGSKVGYQEVTLVTNTNEGFAPFGIPNGTPRGYRINPIPGVTKVALYDLVPRFGEPSLNGFIVAGGKKVFIESEVAWQSDYHASFRIKMPEEPPHPNPGVSTLISRQVAEGRSGDGTYLTNPTTCFNSEDPGKTNIYASSFLAESYGEEDPSFPLGTSAIPATFPPGLIPTGCQNVPFDIGIKVDPGTTAADSPAPATIDTTLPFITGGTTVSESHLRNASETTPVGMGLNPSSTADGTLVACTDAQFRQSGTRAPVICPAASRIGSVAIETPVLPAGSLKGNIYLGQQLSRDPLSGEEFRIFIDAEAPEQGISVRLIGHTKADPVTGRLTTEINENPQTPFTSVKLRFDGSHSVLTSPPTCAKAETISTMVPWSTPASTRHPSSSFTLSSVPGGGSCPTTLAARKFTPTYAAATDSTKAAAYTPFKVQLGRTDGQQELKLVNVTLPKGLTARLKGIPYCSEEALAAAALHSGKVEQSTPSCSEESLLGGATTASGTGAAPLTLNGKVYLAGPYKGAPLSLAIITPAVSGPFDLGTVVVRVALTVDPVSAQVTAVSDQIPDVFGGVKLDIRAINLNLDRKEFMRNPTNCSAQAIAGAINGGGADPTNPAAWSSYPVSVPFQASACKKLAFKPKLHVRIQGPTKRAKNPQIRAILEAPSGQANIARTALTLPHSLFLDQSHIGTVCTRPKLAAHECPKASVYGYAEAITPLLGKPLKGHVYLVSSNHKLSDLVADLRGQVEIQLHGVVGSKHGGLKTVFNSPDVPVKKFILNMRGGEKSLIVNSTNTCKAKQTAVLHIKAQNGKKLNTNKLPLAISGCQSPNGNRGK